MAEVLAFGSVKVCPKCTNEPLDRWGWETEFRTARQQHQEPCECYHFEPDAFGCVRRIYAIECKDCLGTGVTDIDATPEVLRRHCPRCGHWWYEKPNDAEV